MTFRSEKDNQGESTAPSSLEGRLASWEQSAPRAMPADMEARVRQRLERTLFPPLPPGRGGKRPPTFLMALLFVLLTTTAFIWRTYDAPLLSNLLSGVHSCLQTTPPLTPSVPIKAGTLEEHCH